MVFTSQILLGALTLSPALANPVKLEARQSTLPNFYTLTAYAPDDANLNGAKFQNGGNLFGKEVASYCPTSVGASCPNGTETVFSGAFYPACLVPGGQDLYVTHDGDISITVQHSHYIPSDAYHNYEGWSWNALPTDTYSASMPDCPVDDPRYNCDTPSGYWTFHAPDAAEDVGGVVACPDPNYPESIQAYAVTPSFNRTDCTPMVGLGTHNYTGVNPPVWSYM